MQRGGLFISSLINNIVCYILVLHLTLIAECKNTGTKNILTAFLLSITVISWFITCFIFTLKKLLLLKSKLRQGVGKLKLT